MPSDLRTQPALAIARPRGLSLGEARLWALLIVGVAYWGNVVRTAPHTDATGIAAVLQGIIGNGVFGVAAWAMIAARAPAMPRGGAAKPSDVALHLALGALCVLPTRQTVIVALIALAAMLGRRAAEARARTIAVLLLGLAGEMIWTSTYVLPLHALVATLDARVVRGTLDAAGFGVAAHGNLIDAPGGTFGLEVLAYCASSFPLAGVCLAFAVTVVERGRLPRPGDLPWLAASLAASVALTEIRLAWMTMDGADFTWLHDGNGAVLYALAAAASAVLFPALATRQRRSAGERR